MTRAVHPKNSLEINEGELIMTRKLLMAIRELFVSLEDEFNMPKMLRVGDDRYSSKL